MRPATRQAKRRERRYEWTATMGRSTAGVFRVTIKRLEYLGHELIANNTMAKGRWCDDQQSARDAAYAMLEKFDGDTQPWVREAIDKMPDWRER